MIAVTGALVGLTLATTGSAGATAAPVSARPAAATNAFYVPPATLPAANGALIRTAPQKLGVSLQLPGQTKPVPGTGTKIMYKSTDALGRAVAVTGAYIEPDKAWTGSGPRPLVAYAEGTQGQGDACAPTKTLESPLVIDQGNLALGYELPNIYNLLDKGIAVVVTDYIGLGTPDRIHTYTDRVDMGHALLDAARAARKLSGTSITSASPIGLFGYSQGGGATASASELAPSYAPELPLKGAFVGAPPANLRKVLDSADGTALTGVIGYAINGLVAYRPSLKTQLDAQVNDAGKAVLAKVANQCIGDTLLSYAFKKTSEWTKSGKPAGAVVDTIPDALAAIAAQKLGTIKPQIPTMVLTGTQDDIVDHSQAKQLAQDWCNKGANVTYTPIIQAFPSGGTALNHLGPLLSDGGKGADFLVDRFANKPVISNCLILPVLP